MEVLPEPGNHYRRQKARDVPRFHFAARRS
jgi:hypothetical protein